MTKNQTATSTNHQSLPATIEHWPVERLVPYEHNARTHSSAQIEQIARSMVEFGFTNPILVDGKSGILAGHARLCAARSLNFEKVPVIVLDHFTDIQKRAYILADNQLALNAGWDDSLLAEQLARLREEGFLLETVGFDDEALAALLGEHTPPPDPDSAPEIRPIPVSRPGDVWLLGPHRVHCGDATLAATVEILMAGRRASMVFTDPPYNVGYCAGGRPIENDRLGAGFGPFLTQACANMLVCTDGAIYICMSSSELHTLHRAFTSSGGHWSTFLIWSKDRFTLGRSDYQRQYEPILYGWREGSEHYWCGDRSQGDVWCVDKPLVNDLHPTMKPVDLIQRAIHNSSRKGELVLDLFAGSGSTLMACELTGRHARMLELDPVYVDVIVRRWQQYTGKDATLDGDGRCFEEVSAERIPVTSQPDFPELPGTTGSEPVAETLGSDDRG
jgi:DNA modification methylase